MCTVRNTPLKIVRRGKVLDFVCRWLIEVKVKISENDVFFFFKVACIKEIRKLVKEKEYQLVVVFSAR